MTKKRQVLFFIGKYKYDFQYVMKSMSYKTVFCKPDYQRFLETNFSVIAIYCWKNHLYSVWCSNAIAKSHCTLGWL